MKTTANNRITVWLGTLGVACSLALTVGAAAHAEEKMTAQSLIDRQQILNQITRYYYNFGKAERQAEESFYAEDGVLILGSTRYEGREGIKQAYHRRAAPAAATAPAPDAAPAAPPRERTAFNVMIGNPLIIVHGDKATSEVIFTEYRQDKKGDPMKMTVQGKEFATWVKVKGQWLYKTRQIANDSEPPADWKE